MMEWQRRTVAGIHLVCVLSSLPSALLDLYLATDGFEWTRNVNWLDGDPCHNHWEGVTCDGKKITHL